MLDEQDINKLKEVFATKEDFEKLATKEDLKNEIEGLAVLVNNAFNENEKRMAEGFKMVREEFKTVNDKLDTRLEKAEEGVRVIKEVLVIK